MEGVDFVNDLSGNLKEIRLDVTMQPQLAENVKRLIAIHKRHHKPVEEPLSPSNGIRTGMSLKHFQHLIRESKLSGELSETDFFQLHPEWQKNLSE